VTDVRIEAGAVWRITLDRPEARNAVSSAMLAEMSRALREAAIDPQARVVLLGGTGDHFCAGADLEEVSHAPADGFGYGLGLEAVLAAMADHPLPVIARVQGAALGAGGQLLSACDLVVAADDVRIGIPSSRLGIVIGFESVQRLVLTVGPRRASELLLTGREITAGEAAAWGLVTEAVPGAHLAQRADSLAAELAGRAPLSVRASKRGIGAVLRKLSIDREAEGYRLAEFDMMAADALSSDDLREGLRARRERRPPEFRGS
jgi:enoyl-CoA hydratase/carnithine racemase